MASRNNDAHHDASRRFKSELLTHLDGILTSNEQILVLAATNSPWYVTHLIKLKLNYAVYNKYVTTKHYCFGHRTPCKQL